MHKLILGLTIVGSLAVLPAVALASNRCATSSVCFQRAIVTHDRIKPRTLNLTADGTLEVNQIRWRTWGGGLATGHGIAEYHGCTPSCGQGAIHHASVVVRLSVVVACDGSRYNPSGLYYDRVRLIEHSGASLDASYLRRMSWAPCE